MVWSGQVERKTRFQLGHLHYVNIGLINNICGLPCAKKGVLLDGVHLQGGL